MRHFGRGSVLVVLAASAAAYCQGQAPKADVEPFYPAYLAPGTPPALLLFPMHGPELKVDLPTGLNANFTLIGSSPDGKAIYLGRSSYPEPYPGITRIEFSPARRSIVPGSAGLGQIWNLIESPQSGKIFVSASTMRDGRPECGDYEIDPGAGIFRPLRIAAYPECFGSVSPDGKRDLRIKRELRAPSGQLILRELATGAEQIIGKGYAAASWSPDGRWIAAVHEPKDIVLIDTNNLSKKIKLGSGDGPLVWSPDSKWLVLPRSELSCVFTLYFESLQILNVETRRKTKIPSSHCDVLGGATAWLSRDIAH